MRGVVRAGSTKQIMLIRKRDLTIEIDEDRAFKWQWHVPQPSSNKLLLYAIMSLLRFGFWFLTFLVLATNAFDPYTHLSVQAFVNDTNVSRIASAVFGMVMALLLLLPIRFMLRERLKFSAYVTILERMEKNSNEHQSSRPF